MKKPSISPIAAAIHAALFMVGAHAQDKTEPAKPAEPAAATEVQQIQVTAQKRLQRGQDVPISMSVVAPTTLETRGVTDPLSLSLVAPTLQVGDGNSFSLRGIGTLNTAGNQLLEGAVATAVDGVSLARASMGNIQFADIERIEVLNGPQGMLFGKNATAGLMNIVTARPRLGRSEGRVFIDMQHRDSGAGGNGVVVQGVYNAPISEKSALRINAFGTHQDDLVNQVGPAVGSDLGEKQSGVKLKYLVEATPDLNVYLIADYAERKGAGGTPFARTRREFGPGSAVAPQLVPFGVVASPENTTVVADGTNNYHSRSQGLLAEVNYELGGGYSLVNILARRGFREYAIQDGDGVAIDALSTILTDFKFSQVSNELRLVSPAGERFEGQAGLYLFSSRVDGDVFMHGQLGLGGPVIPGTQYNIGGIARNELKSSNAAIFGQGSYKITKDWQALLGMRYTRERDTMRLVQNADPFGLVPLYSPTLDVNAKANDNNFTFKLGTQYDLARDVMAYATFARGAKGPGFNAGVGSLAMLPQLAVRPEKVNAIELGIKSVLLSRRLMLNASLFDQRYTDLQAQSFNQALQSFITQNAGKSRSRGVDLTVQARPDEHWTINAAAVLLDAKFTTFTNAQCYTNQPPQNPDGTCNVSGQTLPNSPKQTYSASAEYQHAVGGGMRVAYEVNAYHRSGVNFGIGDDPKMAVGSMTLLGAAVSLSDAASKWRFSLYCRNCTDKRVVMSISPDAQDAAQAHVASYLQQFGYNSFRTFGATAEYRF